MDQTRNFSGCSGRGFYKRQDAVDWLLTAARRAKIEGLATWSRKWRALCSFSASSRAYNILGLYPNHHLHPQSQSSFRSCTSTNEEICRSGHDGKAIHRRRDSVPAIVVNYWYACQTIGHPKDDSTQEISDDFSWAMQTHESTHTAERPTFWRAEISTRWRHGRNKFIFYWACRRVSYHPLSSLQGKWTHFHHS